MSNMEIWNRVKTVPQERLKTIQAGRLKGKSDINPQWRYEVLTEVFGMCGFGWKYTIDRQWLENGDNGSIAAFVNISLYVKQGGEWSEAIPANGGSMFIENESRGQHTSDEAFKMAITDALGTAAKMIGVAADVYMGKNETKYPTEPQKQQPQQRQPEKPFEPEKPWLSPKQFEQAKERIMNGEPDVLAKLEAAFRMKAEYKNELKKAHEYFVSSNS